MQITVLGVPDSAGAYCVGVENAPAALRGAGLVEALTGAGHDVRDAGDLTRRSWAPDPERPFVQNLPAERDAALELSGAAAPLLVPGARLLVLGGSCTVAVGTCAAMQRAGHRPRLVYVDRHLDLNTPDSTTEGSLSWMGMAHCLDLPGAAPELAHLVGSAPLLAPDDLVYLGVEEATETTAWEREQRRTLGLHLVAQAELVQQPDAAAGSALEALGPGPFLVHLDVDVLDFLDAPLAENVNGRNSGPTLAQLQPALARLWQHPDCLGLSIGQLDPAHAAADPTVLDRFVAALVGAVG